MARKLGYPAVEVLAVGCLAIAAINGGDYDRGLQLVIQAEQIPADIPGWMIRAGSTLAAAALMETGELAAAEQIGTATLAQSRAVGDLRVLGSLLSLMADLDLRAGRNEDAAARIRESLQITMRTGIWFELINILYHCAELCAQTGRPVEALTAWAAHAAFARREGFLDGPDAGRRLESERELRVALGPAEADAAEQRGTAMSQATAAEYVLLLTAPARPAGVPDPGPAQLTARERELVTLVAQGRTDAQIAAQLSVSVRTVSSRLGRIATRRLPPPGRPDQPRPACGPDLAGQAAMTPRAGAGRPRLWPGRRPRSPGRPPPRSCRRTCCSRRWRRRPGA